MPELIVMQLQYKIVVVTDAASGLGAATSVAMARRGAHVVLLGLEHSALTRVAREIRRHEGSVSVYPVDLADLAAVTRVACLIEAEVGCPEVLVHCADTPDAALHSTRVFLPNMIACAEGQIVGTTSALQNLRPLQAELTDAGVGITTVHADRSIRHEALAQAIVRAVERGSRDVALSAWSRGVLPLLRLKTWVVSKTTRSVRRSGNALANYA